jgi:transposase-like protein
MWGGMTMYYWLALKTTNPIERINKEFKKRSRSMGTLGEQSLECLLAFTALRLEMGWKQVSIDAAGLAKAFEVRHKANALEETVAELIH